MSGIPYPPKNMETIITFREPFPRVKYEPKKVMYVRAIMFGALEQDIRFDGAQQMMVVEELLKQDGKILNARVLSKNSRFEVIEHSPQTDFFDMVEGANSGRDNR